jgi:hypothetical protein
MTAAVAKERKRPQLLCRKPRSQGFAAKLPSPSGRGVGGEGGAYKKPEKCALTPAPLPEGEGFSRKARSQARLSGLFVGILERADVEFLHRHHRLHNAVGFL